MSVLPTLNFLGRVSFLLEWHDAAQEMPQKDDELLFAVRGEKFPRCGYYEGGWFRDKGTESTAAEPFNRPEVSYWAYLPPSPSK